MYEVVTQTFPYPDFQDGKMNEFKFIQKVVNDNYRPQFKYPIKKSIRRLIERCWSDDPKLRPTFEEIFNKLAYNKSDKFIENIFELDQKDDNDNDDDDNEEEDFSNFYLEDVDVEEILLYVESIIEEKKIESINYTEFRETLSKIKKKNHKMKKKISSLKIENEQLKTDLLTINHNITVGYFNSLSLQQQKLIVFKIIQNC